MTVLAIFSETGGRPSSIVTEPDEIQSKLNSFDVIFERWQAGFPFPQDAEPATILDAYLQPIEKLKAQFGFQSIDVISMHPEHPQKQQLREKFLSEHRHDDFEVRFFIHGQGLFYLHLADKVYALLCTQGDLISVPNNTPHWFDMGTQPDFKCIRFFTTAEGWVAQFTGSDIAARLPDFDHFVEHYA